MIPLSEFIIISVELLLNILNASITSKAVYMNIPYFADISVCCAPEK